MISKVHRSLVEGVVFALTETFIANRKSDKVLAQLFKQNKKWGSRDRGFIAENTYDIVRWWRSITEALGINYLQIKGFQIWYVVKAWLHLQGYDITSYKEWDKVDVSDFISKFKLSKSQRVLKASIPDWLDNVGLEFLGEEQWEQKLSSINDQAPVFIRANLFKNDAISLQSILSNEGIETELVKGAKNSLKLTKRQNIFISQAFKDGRFEVQDPGSQLIVELVDVKPGLRVVDACAGAGGKSLYLSNLMENKGQLISLDIEQWKLEELKKRARRNGAHNIETRLIEAKTIKRLKNSADRLLLDVPCTGLGTLRRNPDAKWKLSKEFLDKVVVTQAEILQNYAGIVRKGGKMVYATCSILPIENELQVQKFLQHNPDWVLIEEKWTDTANTSFDGFYMALIQHKE
jgi:16S rRNA (cytosine967-C5)-methyltransferase